MPTHNQQQHLLHIMLAHICQLKVVTKLYIYITNPNYFTRMCQIWSHWHQPSDQKHCTQTTFMMTPMMMVSNSDHIGWVGLCAKSTPSHEYNFTTLKISVSQVTWTMTIQSLFLSVDNDNEQICQNPSSEWNTTDAKSSVPENLNSN